MANRGECFSWFVSILFLLITLIFFLGFIGLAVAGIINSQIDDERYTAAVDDADDNFNDLWVYFLGVSSLCSIPYSVFGAIAVTFLVKSIKATREGKQSCHPKKSTSTDHKKTEEQSQPIVRQGNAVRYIDKISGEKLYPFTGAELATTSVPALVAVFVSLLTSAMAMSGILWGIAIAYNNARVVDKEVYVYIVVEVLVGLVTPILAIISAATFSVFLEYTTQGSLDARVFITHLLPVVKLVRGEKKQYWVIGNRFYFEIKELDTSSRMDCSDIAEDVDGDKDSRVPCSKYCTRTPTTWILAIIVSLAFLLSISYFMNQNITEQITVRTCPHSSIETDCFNRTTFEYIDCENEEVANTTFELLHCFRFLRFGRDSDVIGGVSRSFAFYLATLAFFTSAFHVANVLINFVPSRLWGVGFVVIGFLTVGVGLTVLFTREAVLLHLDVIQVFQVFMVAMFILLIGLLLLIGKWWEKVGESGKGKNKGRGPAETELVSIENIGTTKGNIKKTERDLREVHEHQV